MWSKHQIKADSSGTREGNLWACLMHSNSILLKQKCKSVVTKKISAHQNSIENSLF